MNFVKALFISCHTLLGSFPHHSKKRNCASKNALHKEALLATEGPQQLRTPGKQRGIHHLAGLQAAGHTELVDAAAAVGQAAVTAVQLGAGHVHIAAAIHQQVLPLTDVAWKTATGVTTGKAHPSVWSMEICSKDHVP